MKENKSMGYKIGMFVFITISILLGGYIVYDKVLNTKETTDTNDNAFVTESNQSKLLSNMTSNDNNPSITSLTIDSVNIDGETMNNRLSIKGTINLSVDDNVYDGVSLEGYCLDTNNKRYNMYGPQDGRALFHSGSSDLSLSEDLQSVCGVNWKNVTIEYCKIDKMVAYISTSDDNSLSKITITKDIDLSYDKYFN